MTNMQPQDPKLSGKLLRSTQVLTSSFHAFTSKGGYLTIKKAHKIHLMTIKTHPPTKTQNKSRFLVSFPPFLSESSTLIFPPKISSDLHRIN